MEHQQTNHSCWQHWQWPHGCYKSVFGGCERILQKRKSASTSERWWRVLPLLLVCLLTGSGSLWAESEFHTHELTRIVHSPTINQPYYRLRTLFYDIESWDSYFTHAEAETGHAGPALYIDNHWLCSPDWELAWPGSSGRGNDTGVKNACRDEDGWWGSAYISPVIDGVTYTIKFWDPTCNSSEKCFVDIFIFPDKMPVSKTHTFKLKGRWVINGSNNTYQYNAMDSHDFEFNSGISMGVGSPTGTMSEYGKMKISGKLLKGHGPTTVGTKDSPDISTFSDDLTSFCSPAFPSDNDSYNNLVLDFGDRANYFEQQTKYVQYSFDESYKFGGYNGSTKLYQWYPVYVPGYIRVKSFSTPETYDVWTKKVKLAWTTEGDNNGGTWSIYRYETSKGQSTRELVESGISSSEKSRNVEVPEYYKSYTFDVVFIPTNGQSDPRPELTKSVKYTMSPTWNFTSLRASVSESAVNKISLTWRHPSIGDASGSNPYTLTILRLSDDKKTWNTIKTIQVTTQDTVNSSYQDDYELVANHTYSYKLKINVFGKDVYSEVASTKLGGTKIVNFSASQGSFSTMVKLQWTVKQVGNEITHYAIYRRLLGSNDDWGKTIATPSGTASAYSYDDKADPGNFYEYKLAVWSQNEDGTKSEDDFRTTDGFSVTSGIVSGNITYGTGSGVDGVKVTLKKQNLDGSVSSGMRSLHFAGSNKAGLVYDTDSLTIQKLFAKDFTVQMYLNPTFAAMASTNVNQKYYVLDCYYAFTIYIMPAATYGRYRIVAYLNGYRETGLTIPGDEWTHLTVVHSHDNATLNVIVTYADLTTQKKTITADDLQINWNANALKAKEIAIGNGSSMSANNNFRGYMDEFRFFTKALTDTEIKRNFNHPLAGNESGLAIYYPMDEGLNQQSKAYDFSKTGGVSNERHATTRTVAESSEFIPSESQLSLMAYTDSLGYFEVRGVPFSGDGTSYSVIPELGVHEFSPANRSRYVSINSLIHNGVDFTDVSSFPVSGKVLYSGTSYPVKGVNFYVDGTICTNNGKIAESGEDGSFNISVPIGDHYIEASLGGHTFANGRYPADPDGTNQTLHTFDRETTLLLPGFNVT